MLVAILILLILNLIASILILSGFWDLYKRVRRIETGTDQLTSNEASKMFQQAGKGRDRG